MVFKTFPPNRAGGMCYALAGWEVVCAPSQEGEGSCLHYGGEDRR